MCAVDEEAYSERAMEWLMESLVSQEGLGSRMAGEQAEADSLHDRLHQIEDNDEIVTVTVLEGDPDGELDQENHLQGNAKKVLIEAPPSCAQRSTRSKLEKMPRS